MSGYDPFTLFNLGMTYENVGRLEEAADYLRRCLAHSKETESHLRKAYALLVSTYTRLADKGQEDLSRAWETCRAGLALYPLDAELRFRRAAILSKTGRLREAAAAYHDLLERHEEPHFCSVVAGISGHLARHNLAYVYEALGEFDRAEEQLRRVVQERPRSQQARRDWAAILRRQGKVPVGSPGERG